MAKRIRWTEEKVRKWLKQNRPEIKLVEYGGTTNKKSKFKCKKDAYLWSTTFSGIKMGYGCPVCGLKKGADKLKITECEAKRWLNEHKQTVKLVKYSGAAKGKSKFRCTKCKYEWETAFTYMKRNKGCPRCGGCVCASDKDVKRWLKEHKPTVKLVEYGGNVHNKFKFKCKKDGYEWVTAFSSIKQGSGCPKCAGKLRITEDEVKQWLEQNKPYIDLVEYGGNVRKKSKFRCKKDGYEWEAVFYSIKQGRGCPKCVGHVRVTENDVRKWLHKNCKDIELVEYCGVVHRNSVFKCNKCNIVWNTTFDKIKHGACCPKCNSEYWIDGNKLQSSYEAVCYLYWKLCRDIILKRNVQNGDKGYYLPYKHLSETHKHYFDFIVPSKDVFYCYKMGKKVAIRGIPMEVKPNNGGKDKKADGKIKMAKRRGVIVVGDDDIKFYRGELRKIGVTHKEINAYKPTMKEKEDVVRNWLVEHKPNIELVEYGGYICSQSKFRCTKDGYEWVTTFDNIKRVSGCPKCVGKARVTEDDVREWLKVHTPDIELVEYGGNVHNKSKFKCKKDGYEWVTAFSSVKRDSGCPKCGVRNCVEKLCTTEEEVKEWLKEYKPDIELIEYGGGASKKSKFRCKKDGYEWETTFDKVKHGTGCPKCAGKARVTEKEVRVWLKEKRPDIELIEYGGNVRKKSNFRCKKCSNLWEATFSNIKRGRGCPNYRLHKQKELANGKA